MPGARRARSRVCGVESTRVSHHGYAGNTRHSPRNGFTASFVISSVSRALLPPSQAAMRSIVARLISASGYRDHTTSPSAENPVRLIGRGRPPHPAPNVRDDRETPLWRSTGCESGYSCFYCDVK